MTEFDQKLLHFCRNPKCRTKLKVPTSNSGEAFCSLKPNGCRDRFYRLRCYVCEEKKTGRLDAHTCGRRKCKNAIRSLNRPQDTSRVEIGVGNSIKLGLAEGDKYGRPWRIVAGPPLTPSQFHCATLGGSAMDEVRRIEAKNRAALKAAEEAEIEAHGEFTEAEWLKVTSPDGVGCFVTRFRDAPQQRAEAESNPAAQLAEDLAIPPFLDRRPKAEPAPGQRWPSMRFPIVLEQRGNILT